MSDIMPGQPGDTNPETLGLFVGCSGSECQRGEWSAKAAERGWEQNPAGGWLCPQCAANAADRIDYLNETAGGLLEVMAFRLATGTALVEPNNFRAAVESFRAEARSERDAEIVRWLAKKAGEYRSLRGKENAACAEVLSRMASKIERGAVREGADR